MLPHVLRVPEQALLGLDQGIDAVRVGRREGDRDAPEGAFGHVLRHLLPGCAAVGGAIDARAGAAVHELPRVAPHLPHPGEEDLGVAGGHGELAGSRLVVHVQDLLPARAAVGRAEDPPVGVGRPDVTERRDEDVVRIVGIDHDVRNLADVGQSHEPPRVARVRREVDAVAIHDVVARVGLARADPHQVRVRRRHRDRSDRGGILLEDRLPGVTAVRRLPHAARGGADVDDVRVPGDADDRRHAPAPDSRSEVAELHVLQRSAALLLRIRGNGRGSGGLRGRGPEGGQSRHGREQDADDATDSSQIHVSLLVNEIRIISRDGPRDKID